MSMKDIRNKIQNSTFCCAKEDGQGFVDKQQCICSQKGEKDCSAFHEMNDFHAFYFEKEKDGFSRQEILKTFEMRFNGDKNNSSWYYANVKN